MEHFSSAATRKRARISEANGTKPWWFQTEHPRKLFEPKPPSRDDGTHVSVFLLAGDQSRLGKGVNTKFCGCYRESGEDAFASQHKDRIHIFLLQRK